MKAIVFWFKISPRFGPTGPTQHWFRQKPGIELVPSYELNQWLPSLLKNVWVTRPQRVNSESTEISHETSSTIWIKWRLISKYQFKSTAITETSKINIKWNPVGHVEKGIPINKISFYFNDNHRDFNEEERALTLTGVSSTTQMCNQSNCNNY